MTQKDNRTPLNFEFWIPLQWPLSTDRLVLKVYDKDKVCDEIVGSLCFSLSDLCHRAAVEGGLFTWINLVGSPVNVMGKAATLMDHNPEMGSTWKGRLLMHIECASSMQPEMR